MFVVGHPWQIFASDCTQLFCFYFLSYLLRRLSRDNLELNSSQVTITAWLTVRRPEVGIKVGGQLGGGRGEVEVVVKLEGGQREILMTITCLLKGIVFRGHQ